MSADTDRFVRFSYFGHGINEIYWFILPLLLPKILNEFGLSYLKAGGLLTVYSVMVSLFSFLIGKASDLLPRLKILIAGFLLTFTGFLLAGLSSSLVILTVCVSAGAIGVSAFHPIAYALLDEHTHEAKGRVFGNFECWGMTGAFIMFAVNGLLLSFFSWRTVLILTAFPSLFMVYLAVISAVPDSARRLSAGDQTDSSAGTRPIFLLPLFFSTVVLRIISVLGVLNFVPTYLMKDLAVEEHAAAITSGMYFLGAIIGSRIGGRAGDRAGHVRVLLAGTLVMAPVIYLLGATRIWWTAPPLLLILGIAASSVAPNQNYILSSLSSGMGRGATFGTLVSVLTMTNAFSPLIFGAGADMFGIAHTIRLFSLPMVLSFAVFSVLALTGRFQAVLRADQ